MILIVDDMVALTTFTGANCVRIKGKEFADKEEIHVELLGRMRMRYRARGGNATRTVEKLIICYNCRNQLYSTGSIFLN